MGEKFLKTLKDNWLLLLIILIGALLRWIILSESMSFFYDQARDALTSTGILQGKFVLVGPPADTSGLFMGPLWYYFLAPLYLVSGGHPALVLWLISFFDLATILLLYLVAKKLFDQKTAIIAATFWALGAVSTAYARTLSNPATTAFWSLLIFLGLTEIRQGKEKNLLLVALSLAVLFQINPATAYLLFPYVLFSLFFLRRQIKDKGQLALSVSVFLLTFLPQLIFEIRNHFPSLAHLKGLFLSSQPKEGFFHGLWLKWENFRDELSNYAFYKERDLSLVAFFLSIVFYLKVKSRQKLLFLSWLTLPLVTYFFFYLRGEAHPHYLLGWVPVAVILLAYLASSLNVKFPGAIVVIMALFINSALPGIKKEIFLKEHIAQPADPNRIGLSDEIRVVDYLYKNAHGQPFGYHNYGIVPYWEDKEWQYLFSWYGKGRYGYLPTRRAGNPLFLIYEPDPYLPEFERHWLKDFRREGKGPIVSRTKIAAYIIEEFDKRQINNRQ